MRKPHSVRWVVTELWAQMIGPLVIMGTPCHHFWRFYPMIGPLVIKGAPCHHSWRTCGVACSRVAEEVVCPCLRSSSDQRVGRSWAMVKLMRTPPSEVGLQSARLVVGQRADSPSSIELDVRLVAELVSTLALRKV